MLTVKEAAALLRCSEHHIRDLIHRDASDPEKLPAYYIGRRILLDTDEVKEYLHKQCRI